jgi:eukaryotic-like serine/threonine-protein kinase
MKFRRHLPPLEEWKLPPIDRRRVLRIAGLVLGVLLAGYLTAFFIVFPAPILPGHTEVPRVLGLSAEEAQEAIRQAEMVVAQVDSAPHSFAARGMVTWQDPPPGVVAPERTEVTITVSSGPPHVPVPDLAGLDGALAQRLLKSAGLAVAAVESVPTASAPGVVVVTRPSAGVPVAAGSGVRLVVSKGAASVTVPDLLSLSLGDARQRLEEVGLVLGVATRRTSNDGLPGTVMAQRPAAGTLAVPGSAVDIVLIRRPQ